MAHAIEEVALGARRFGELAVAFHKLDRALLHLRFEVVAGALHVAELALLVADAQRDQKTQQQRVGRVCPRRQQWMRITMQREPQRRTPRRIGAGGAHFEHVIAGGQVVERHAALGTEAGPAVHQSRYAVLQAAVLGSGEIQHREFQRRSVVAKAQRQSLAQPRRRLALRGHAQHFGAGQQHGGGPRAPDSLRGSKILKPPTPPKHSRPSRSRWMAPLVNSSPCRPSSTW